MSITELLTDTDRLVKSWQMPDGSISLNKMNTFHQDLLTYYKGSVRYAYFITFTQDPKKKYHNDNDYIERRILKMLKSKTAKGLYCVYVREGGDEEHKHIHWHVLLESSAYIDSKNLLKNYRNSIGNVDFQKKYSYIYEKPLAYMSKQSPPIVLYDRRVLS